MPILFFPQPPELSETPAPPDSDPSTLEDAAEPVTYTASALTDKWGLYWMVDEEGDESAAASEGAVGLSGALQTVLTAGVRNGDFQQGPASPYSLIDDTNPLPYWSYVRAAGSIDAQWVEDLDAPGGYAVEWTLTNAAAGDTAYFEQIVAVTPRAWRTAVPMAAVEDSGTDVQYIEVTYLRVDGVPTGDTVTSSQWQSNQWGSSTLLMRPVNVPTDARFMRIRFGCQAQANGTSTTTKTLELYAGRPRIIYSTITFSGTTLNPGGSQPIYATSGNVLGTPDNAVNRYIPAFPGWVRSISVVGHNPVNTGSATFRVYNESSSSNVGPTATLDSGNTTASANGDYDASTNRFWENNRLRVTAAATSNINTTGLDTLVHVTFALVDTQP